MSESPNWSSVVISNIQKKCPKKGSQWELYHLDHAHLSISNAQQNHFVRDDTIQLWDSLIKLKSNGNNMRAIWIDGCPGVGKSTTLFGWVLFSAVSLRKAILWVHYEEKNYHLLRIVDSNAATATFKNWRMD